MAPSAFAHAFTPVIKRQLCYNNNSKNVGKASLIHTCLQYNRRESSTPKSLLTVVCCTRKDERERKLNVDGNFQLDICTIINNNIYSYR